jgi:hypothetical protein
MSGTGFSFSGGFFGTFTLPGLNGGFVGLYTTAVLANGANTDVLPVGAGWPGSTTNPYGRVDFTGGGAAATVAGVVAGLDGQIVIFRNTTGAGLTLLDESATEGTPANRFTIGGGDLFLADGQSIHTVYYAGTVNRWVVQQ